jgi:hypothetical protein
VNTTDYLKPSRKRLQKLQINTPRLYRVWGKSWALCVVLHPAYPNAHISAKLLGGGLF